MAKVLIVDDSMIVLEATRLDRAESIPILLHSSLPKAQLETLNKQLRLRSTPRAPSCWDDSRRFLRHIGSIRREYS